METTNQPQKDIVKITEQIIKMFVSIKDYEVNINAPFLIDGYVYATDKHSAIRTKKENCNFDYNTDVKVKLVQFYDNLTLNKELLIKHSDFDKYKTKDEEAAFGEDILCKECDGTGEVEWSYGHHNKDFECPECDGTGYSQQVQYKKTGNKAIPYSCKVLIQNLNGSRVDVEQGYINTVPNFDTAFLTMNYVYRLLKISEMVGEPIILRKITKPNEVVVFSIGIFDIGIMPLAGEDTIDEEVMLVEI